MKNYSLLSLELHLFFCRIMKEHSLFLKVGFLDRDDNWKKKASWYYTQFEDVLRDVVELSDGVISQRLLDCNEIVTPFTLKAERQTSSLTGSQIDSKITMLEQQLRAGDCNCNTKNIDKNVKMINQKALRLVNGLINFKQSILEEVSSCRMFTGNYPLLIEHIIREAKLYRSFIVELEDRGTISQRNRRNTEAFWNQIMMEHALFIRGLLDPTENALIEAADGFAKDYEDLLDEARKKNNCTIDASKEKTIQLTEKYRKFKATGTNGILNCEISGLILPLLADHVLREANHYLCILESSN